MNTISAWPVPSATPPAATRNLEKPSLWLWIPYVWLFFASTRELSAWMAWDKPLHTNSDLGGSAADRLLMISLMT